MYPPPIQKEALPKILFDKIHRIHNLATQQQTSTGNSALSHLTNLFEAYQYVYYVALVDYYLQRRDQEKEDKERTGIIVDWGGFVGQVTILLRSLGYDCENNVLTFPSTKDAFDEFNIPYTINKNPKILPYKDNSVSALLSSGVLEHVHEYEMTDEEALQEIYRVLKPGGYFFCWNLPKKYALLELLALQHKNSCHPIRYHQSQFSKKLENTGFQVIDINSNSGILSIGGVRKVLQLFDPWKQFVFDYYVSQLPGIQFLAHHITAVAQKPTSK